MLLEDSQAGSNHSHFSRLCLPNGWSPLLFQASSIFPLSLCAGLLWTLELDQITTLGNPQIWNAIRFLPLLLSPFIFSQAFLHPHFSSYPFLLPSFVFGHIKGGRRDGKSEGQQSWAQPWQSTALLTCCFSFPAELVQALEAARCHSPSANALSPPGQCSLMKLSWASLTLYQVPQGWQQLLVRHQPHSQPLEGEGSNLEAPRRRQQRQVAPFPICHTPYALFPQTLGCDTEKGLQAPAKMIQLQYRNLRWSWGSKGN